MERHPPGPDTRARRWPAARQAQPVTHTHHEFDVTGPMPAMQAAPPAEPAARNHSEELLAMVGYLGVIFFAFLPALVIFLLTRRSSAYLRFHAARAVNLSITLILFDLSAFIVGLMLALDTVILSLSVALPLATALWLTAACYLVRTALAAARGEDYDPPAWLCVQMLHQAAPTS
ncbi:MAG TPA: DUF4870 domain-containing protein [Streptosporangiaceae bacterium]|nr:DUF4870 domain-containing protein [Streptosporangiaceae bacterium]